MNYVSYIILIYLVAMLILEIFFKDMNLYTVMITFLFFITILCYVVYDKFVKNNKNKNLYKL